MRALSVLALLAARVASAAVPDFLPPETRIVLGISLRGLIDSPLLKGLGDGKATTKAIFAGSPLASIDPLKDVDDVIIASTGTGNNPPALLIARGRFSEKLIPADAKTYNGVAMFEDPRTPNGSFALLDPGTLVAGDLKLLHAAIDQRGQGSVLPKTLAARIAELEGRFDAWGAGEIPEGLQSSAIDRFDFGVSLRQGLEVTGQMHVRSTKDAEKLMEMIRFFEAMFAGQKKTPANGVKFDLKSEHQTVKLSLYVPEEELKKGIQAQKGNLLTAFMGQTMGTAPKPAVTVAPPTPERITTDQRGDTVNVTLPRK
jgi:hypothetical protein